MDKAFIDTIRGVPVNPNHVKDGTIHYFDNSDGKERYYRCQVDEGYLPILSTLEHIACLDK